MIENYHVALDFDLDSLEKEFFAAVEVLTSLPLIDSEQYFGAVVNHRALRAWAAVIPSSVIARERSRFSYNSSMSGAGKCR